MLMKGERLISIRSWPVRSTLAAVAVLVLGSWLRTSWCQATEAASLPPATGELFRAALAEHQGQDLAAAERDYRLVLAQSPGFLPAQFNLGLVLDAQGKTKDALDQFLLVDEELPTFPGSQLFSGIENFRLGKYNASEEALRLATQQSSNDVRGWFWLAKAEFALSHASEGKAALDAALRISPDDPSSLYLLALFYISEQDLARSEEQLTRLVGKYPQVPEFHQSLGSVYYMQARLEKAQAEYNSQLAIDPHNPQALSMLGVILLDRGEASSAIQYLQQGLDANPRIPFLQRKIGQALFAVNRPEEAIQHLHEAVSLDPQDSTSHFLLWKIYTALHRSQNAAEELEAFRKLQTAQENRSPGNPLSNTMLPGMGTPP